MRHLGIVASSAPQASAPSITINTTTNFNQDRATFNATVNPNGATTTVQFQYKRTVDSTWLNSGSVTNITGTSQSVFFNHSSPSLANGTSYDVRAVATNYAGSATSSTTTFTTWSLQFYERTAVGGVTFTIPTVTPTGGSEVPVSIYDIIMFGGGGGGSSGGGGGGGYISQESASLSGARSITTSVGGGGAKFDYVNMVAGTNGGASTISGNLTTLTASGGICPDNNSQGGASGSGFAGGSSGSYSSGQGKIPQSNTGGGGGGGANGTGANGSAGTWGAQGGNGGSGIQISRGGVTVNGGAGGAGGAFAFDSGTAYRGTIGAFSGYGNGGYGTINNNADPSNGGSGYIRFRYYAATALA